MAAERDKAGWRRFDLPVLRLALLAGIFAVGVFLRLSLLEEQYAAHPDGNDGTYEFSIYAEYLLQHTLHGELFPRPLPQQKPFFPLLLAGVYALFPATAYVQYCTTLVLGLGLVLGVYYFLSRWFGPWAGLAGAFFISLNGALGANAVSGYAEPSFLLLLVVFMHLVCRRPADPGVNWPLASVSAALCLTRPEGVPLVGAGLVFLAYLNRHDLRAFARGHALSILLSALGLAAEAWFSTANNMSSYGGRIGRWFLRSDYMDETGTVGIFAMPTWYLRMFIGRDTFDVTTYEWLLKFHDGSQIARIVVGSLLNIGLVIVEQLTLPVVLLGAAGLVLALRDKRVGSAQTVLSLSMVWGTASVALLSVFAHGLGTGLSKYYLVIILLYGLLCGYGVHRVVVRLARQLPLWCGACIVLFLCTGYGYAHLAPAGSTTTAQVQKLPGEAECIPAFDQLVEGDVDGAERLFDEVLRANPNYAPAHFGLALIRFLEGELAGALLSFQRAQTLFPWYAEAYVGSATVRLKQGDYAGAIDDLTTCLELRPDYAMLHVFLAQAYERQEDGGEQALIHYDAYLSGIRALRYRIMALMESIVSRSVGKGLEGNLKTLGLLHRKLGTEGEPLLDLDLYEISHIRFTSTGTYDVGGQGLWFARPAGDAWIYLNQGNLHLAAGRVDLAEQAYDRALGLIAEEYEEQPQFYRETVLVNLGETYLFAENVSDNKLAWVVGQLENLKTKGGLLYSNIACFYAKLGDREKARTLLEQAVAYNPQNQIAQQNLAAIKSSGLSASITYQGLKSKEIWPYFAFTGALEGLQAAVAVRFNTAKTQWHDFPDLPPKARLFLNR